MGTGMLQSMAPGQTQRVVVRISSSGSAPIQDELVFRRKGRSAGYGAKSVVQVRYASCFNKRRVRPVQRSVDELESAGGLSGCQGGKFRLVMVRKSAAKVAGRACAAGALWCVIALVWSVGQCHTIH